MYSPTWKSLQHLSQNKAVTQQQVAAMMLVGKSASRVSAAATASPAVLRLSDAEREAASLRRLEDALDSRTAELIALRKAAVEHAAASPIKSAPLQSALGAWASAPSPLG